MTPPTDDTRLDALVATLAATRPILDDVARARVAQRLDAARTSVSAPVRSRRWAYWGLGAAAAAAIALVVAMRGGDGDAVPRASGELAAGATVVADPNTSVQRAFDGSALTLYGPGWARRDEGKLVVDAQALVIDRTHGDAPLVIEYRATTIRVIRATFSVDGARPRVSVMRGEVELVCDGEARVVSAGESATCAAITAAVPTPPPVAPPVVASTPPPPDEKPAARTARVERPATVRAEEEAIAPSEPAEVAAAPVVEAPSSDLAARYTAAEALMHTDRAGARAALHALVADHPAAPEAAAASLDLARLALADGDTADALRSLDRLTLHADAAKLAMPAAYLRCQVELRIDRTARGCLARFRTAFPGSIHDADALARLATATAAAGDCATARPLLDEYLARYRTGSNAAAVQAWRERCPSESR